MSFSLEIKEELSKTNNLAKKEQVKYEFIGYRKTANTTLIKKDTYKYSTESEYNINRFAKLLNNLNIKYSIEIQGNLYIITYKLEEINNEQYKLNIEEILKDEYKTEGNSDNLRCFLRGVFLGSGYVNNPQSKYHLELIFQTKENAEEIYIIAKKFNIEFKKLKRKYSYSLYTKEGEKISEFLALIGANSSVLKFEEVRVLRDVSNKVNRLVNCETANLNKTINASVMQCEAIKKIKKKGKFKDLPDSLKEIAEKRLENPNMSLAELGQNLKEPLGKSGVNHRLKKIVQIAEELN